jgi:hypothetical protein
MPKLNDPAAASGDDLLHATMTAIAAGRALVKQLNSTDGVIPAGTPIGRLGDVEWGWLACAVIFAWLKTRSEQATEEGLRRAIRFTGQQHEPWDLGAIAAILPQLAELNLPWDKPLGSWSKDQICRFLADGLRLANHGFASRDFVVDRQPSAINADVETRKVAAASGGPLMTPAETQVPW